MNSKSDCRLAQPKLSQFFSKKATTSQTSEQASSSPTADECLNQNKRDKSASKKLFKDNSVEIDPKGSRKEATVHNHQPAAPRKRIQESYDECPVRKRPKRSCEVKARLCESSSTGSSDDDKVLLSVDKSSKRHILPGKQEKVEISRKAKLCQLSSNESSDDDKLLLSADKISKRRYEKDDIPTKVNIPSKAKLCQKSSSDDDEVLLSSRKSSMLRQTSEKQEKIEVQETIMTSSTPPESLIAEKSETPPTKQKKNLECRSVDRISIDRRRHDEFVKKVGLLRKSRDDSVAGLSRVDGDRLEPCALEVPKGVKLTPFEEQVVKIKRAHPSTVMFVECGYKFRFVGRDAEIAAKVLNIFHHMDHSFLSASIPTFRLQIHVRRMVEAGYKVGVIRQTETAALKAASANKSKTFERSLCEVYTKATIPVEDVDILGLQHSASPNTAVYLLAVIESHEVDGNAADGHQQLGMLAVDTASGDMVYDEWMDNALRTELESRLSQLQPKELLLPTKLSAPSRNLLRRIATAGSLRVETLDDTDFDVSGAARSVQKWLRNKAAGAGGKELSVEEVGCVGEGRVAGGAESVLNLPHTVLACMNALHRYLSQFNLQQVLKLTGNLWRFSSPTHMIVEASVLENLEVLSTEKGDEGSLFWLLKTTHTAFGARLLRHWICHPLLCLDRIEARHEAVAELLTDPPAAFHWEELIKGLPDLERALARVQYRKCGPGELVALLNSLAKLCLRAKQGLSMAEELRSPLLRSLMSAFPDVADAIRGWLDAINVAAAAAGSPDTFNLLVGFEDEQQYPEIFSVKQEMAQVERELEDHLEHWRISLRMPDLEFKSILTTPYLIEIPVGQVNKVPKNWLKMSGTQKVARFHTPTVQEKYAHMNRLQERLTGLCSSAWQDFLANVAVRYAELRSIVQALGVLDCLMSLARVARRSGWTRPEMVRGEETVVDIEAGRHPMVEAIMGDRYVPNDVHLSRSSQRAMIITGPNMGGKSSLIRQTALIALMAQVGSFVPARKARLSVVDAIYTRMGARDAISQGRSTFLVEMQEASHILQRATSRSLVIMDELGRGTSTHDGTAIAFATLRELVEGVGCLSLFVTHYHLLCSLAAALPSQVGSFHVGFLAGEGDRVTFLYRLVSGPAHRSFGLNVALLAGLPAPLVDRARVQSASMEASVKRRTNSLAPMLARQLAAVAADGAAGLGGLQTEVRRLLPLLAPPA